MDIDIDRIDAAILALLLLGLHDRSRVWKTFDWDAMNRLHDKGLISESRWQGEVCRPHREGPSRG
jgi:hypothetical protein